MKNFSLVVFGATGDLTKRKLIPALYHLLKTNNLQDYVIVCIGRRPWNDRQYQDYVKEFIKAHLKSFNEDIWKSLCSRIFYFESEFNDSKKISGLSKFLSSLEKKYKIDSNRLYYMATMPENYDAVIKAIKKFKLHLEVNGFRRIILEKPFGYDLKSAEKLNKVVMQTFKENQVYRIDHYLGKETVGNILVFRFTNTIFDPVWNSKYIDSIQITTAEDISIEDRGNYYDKAGVVRDFVQNHIMQLLCLVTMDCTGNFGSEAIRREKVELLKAVDHKSMKFILGQYEGYRNEKNVAPDSSTPTFIALKLFINNSRWKNVPIYIRTGKKLREKTSLIHINFKDERCILDDKLMLESNDLTIKIQPEQDIIIRFNAKKPGLKLDTQKVKMEFCYECEFGIGNLEAYEKLLNDAVNGDMSLFTSWEETRLSWIVVDSLLKKKNILFYKPSSWGPKEADALIKKDGRVWFDK